MKKDNKCFCVFVGVVLILGGVGVITYGLVDNDTPDETPSQFPTRLIGE